MAFELNNPNHFTPPVIYQTNVPLPVLSTSDDPDALPQWHDTRKITASVCAEYTTVTRSVSAVEATHRISMALDPLSQPVVFTVGSDERFNCVRHVMGNSDSWIASDIMPSESTSTSFAQAFDILQSPSGSVSIAVAVSGTLNGPSDIFFASDVSLDAAAFEPGKPISYTKVTNNLGAKSVSSIRIIAPAKKSGPGAAPKPYLLVGTQESTSTLASTYVVSLDKDNAEPWKHCPLPQTAKRVVTLAPATLRPPYGPGTISLYSQADADAPRDEFGHEVGTSVSFINLAQTQNVSIPLHQLGGRARDVTGILNGNGMSDVYVAGDSGIGYYDCNALSSHPSTILLPTIAFRQITGTEVHSRITLLATSVSGELYYIEGSRASKGEKPTFKCSGFPFMKDVGMVSAVYNSTMDSCECVYAGKRRYSMVHLTKDLASTLWTPQPIHVRKTGKVAKFPAFVTQVTLKADDGSSLETIKGLEVDITCAESKYASVNESSHRLSPSSQVTLIPDTSGTLSVLLHADSLSAPTLTFTLRGGPNSTSTSYTFSAEPGARVLRHFASMQSGDDIKNARTTTGQSVFAGMNIDKERFDATAKVLSGAMVGVARDDPGMRRRIGHAIPDRDPGNEVLFEVGGGGGGWADKVDQVCHDIGDFLQGLIHGLFKPIKWVLRKVGKVISFILDIAGKIVAWVITTTKQLVKSAVGFVCDVLGIDPSQLPGWLGFLFDWDNIIREQSKMASNVLGTLTLLQQSTGSAMSLIKDLMSNAKDAISSAVPDKRDQAKIKAMKDDVTGGGSSSFFSTVKGILSFFFDNPIFREVGGVLGSLAEELLECFDALFGESIIIPGLGAFLACLAKLTATVAQKEAGNLQDFFIDIMLKVREFADTDMDIGSLVKAILGDAFWTMYDSVEIILDALLTAVPELLAAFVSLICGTIQLPFVTPVWKAITDIDLSILNIVTLIPAIVMHYVKIPAKILTPMFDKAGKQGEWTADDVMVESARTTALATVTPEANVLRRRVLSAHEETEGLLASDELDFTEAETINFATATAVPAPTKPAWSERQYQVTDAILGILASSCGILGSFVDARQSKFDAAKHKKEAEIKIEMTTMQPGGGVLGGQQPQVPQFAEPARLQPGARSKEVMKIVNGFNMAFEVLTIVNSAVWCASAEERKSEMYVTVVSQVLGAGMVAFCTIKDPAYSEFIVLAGNAVSTCFPGFTSLDISDGVGTASTVLQTVSLVSAMGGCIATRNAAWQLIPWFYAVSAGGECGAIVCAAITIISG